MTNRKHALARAHIQIKWLLLILTYLSEVVKMFPF